jgi:AraC family transcriptional regulator of adaptative response / DNA-3-methyladenine glycosylase II
VPGAWDGLEIAVRAVLGQQVSVRAARTLAARLVARLGEPCGGDEGGGRSFPSAERLAGAGETELAALGILPARARTLIALARAQEDGALRLDRGADVDETIAALVALPGIGEWTAQYVAMRALRWPDALPAGDLVLQQALGGAEGRATAREVKARAERWSPWRSYGVMHLWAERAEEQR